MNDNFARGSQRNVGGANAAAAAITRTMPALAKKRHYITGFDVTGAGATAATNIEVTVTGLTGGTLTFVVAVPAGVNSQVAFSKDFDMPLEAALENTAVTLSVPSFGAGNVNANANLYGFTTERG